MKLFDPLSDLWWSPAGRVLTRHITTTPPTQRPNPIKCSMPVNREHTSQTGQATTTPTNTSPETTTPPAQKPHPGKWLHASHGVHPTQTGQATSTIISTMACVHNPCDTQTHTYAMATTCPRLCTEIINCKSMQTTTCKA